MTSAFCHPLRAELLSAKVRGTTITLPYTSLPSLFPGSDGLYLVLPFLFLGKGKKKESLNLPSCQFGCM